MPDTRDPAFIAWEEEYLRTHDKLDFSDGSYPPFYTAPTPRWCSPEPEYMPVASTSMSTTTNTVSYHPNYPVEDVYPTPNASPYIGARGQCQKLPNDMSDFRTGFEQVFKILEEYKNKNVEEESVTRSGKRWKPDPANAQNGSGSGRKKKGKSTR
ncbi:hypothetical protein BDN70DRAFT_174887 [Pholiota conissans]|uniref:Uncharacterized protein n=1 Tax=Pholiota conissans TaxID=109636 RepID=A0A9P5YXK2_9AGAR|nr:hypothetical protein BDN70DRAFT_174887 [Pholiota conissans]